MRPVREWMAGGRLPPGYPLRHGGRAEPELGGYHDMARASIVSLEPILRLRPPPRPAQNRKIAGDEALDAKASSHGWMTSSACPRIDCGIVSPSAFAVLRLMTS